MREKKYPGFGVEKSVTGWATFLGLPYATVWRHLNEGLTPEEIATTKGLTLDMSKLQEVPKQLQERIAELERLVADLLDASNYDPDGVDIELNQNKKGGNFGIVWNGVSIGTYSYQLDVLHLTGGDSLRLRWPTIEGQMISRDEAGRWNIHPETKKRIYDEKYTKTFDF